MKKLLIVVAILGVGVLFLANNNQTDNNSINTKKSPELTRVSNLRDIHGLTVDVADSSKVWIASHTGFHLLNDDKDLFVVGSSRDDYMGLSADPTNPDVFYASGHPPKGGNLGILKTRDAGLSWQKISDGVNGPVDFHTMAVSQIEPDLIYGSYAGNLQKSLDGGNNWAIVKTDLPNVRIIRLVTDPKEKDTVYATTDGGLFVSRDQAVTWQTLSPDQNSGAFYTLAINPSDNQKMLIYSQKLGLAKTSDGGNTWIGLEANIATSPVIALAYDKNKPDTIYGANQKLEIYKSTDGSLTWKRIR